MPGGLVWPLIVTDSAECPPAVGTVDSEHSAVTGRGSPRLESQGMSRERCPSHAGDVHSPGTAVGAGAGWSQAGRAVVSIPFKHRCSAL